MDDFTSGAISLSDILTFGSPGSRQVLDRSSYSPKCFVFNYCFWYTKCRPSAFVLKVIVDVIEWKLDLQLPVRSMPITTEVVSSNPAHVEVCSISHYVIKFVSYFHQVGGFLWFLTTITQTTTFSLGTLVSYNNNTDHHVCMLPNTWKLFSDFLIFWQVVYLMLIIPEKSALYTKLHM